MNRKILIMTGHYYPGVKGGGPIFSIKNLVDILGNEIDFYILTSDRDLGDKKPFINIIKSKWQMIDKYNVYYTNTKRLSLIKLVSIIKNVDYNLLYLNSFFSLKFSIIPLVLSKLKILPQKPIVLSPRGQFSIGALNFKKIRKYLYILIAQLIGLYEGIEWHVTSVLEKEDIIKIFGPNIRCHIANNLTTDYSKLVFKKNKIKKRGELSLIFFSRIHPKKNLLYAIDILKMVKGNVKLDIYGSLEDEPYWNLCLENIKYLPENIKVEYRGVLLHDLVLKTFNDHHFLFFPTLGENYGHVISESLVGCCPLIISDQTPWRNLEEKGVGWDIELSNTNKFIDIINYCVNMNGKDYSVMAEKAFYFGISKSNSLEDIGVYRNLFNNTNSY